MDSRGTLSVLLDLLKGPLSVSGTGDLTMTSCNADVLKVFFYYISEITDAESATKIQRKL